MKLRKRYNEFFFLRLIHIHCSAIGKESRLTFLKLLFCFFHPNMHSSASVRIIFHKNIKKKTISTVDTTLGRWCLLEFELNRVDVHGAKERNTH